MRKNNNIAVNRRYEKRSGDAGLVKMVFLDNEIKPKIKLDVRNAAVSSITKYSTTTVGTAEAYARKCNDPHPFSGAGP